MYLCIRVVYVLGPLMLLAIICLSSVNAFPHPKFIYHPNHPTPLLLHDTSANDIQNPDSALVGEYTAFAQELADAAADAIQPYWRLPVKIDTKTEDGRSLAQTRSPVTAADRSAERRMRNLIEAKYPSHGIYGEEFGQVRVDADFVWVLDPIDGTKAFITGKPTFGTLIACLYRGVPIVGIIDQCILKERWVGALGCPTSLNGKEVRVEPSARKLQDATVYTTTPDMFRLGEELDKFEAVRDRSLRTLYGCDCYAYALVASGFGADAVVEADLGLYDYCAIVPVLEGAGGVISDWRGEQLTLWNHEASEGRVVACSNAELHAQMVGILSEQWAAGWRRRRLKRTAWQLLTLFLGIAIGASVPGRWFS